MSNRLKTRVSGRVVNVTQLKRQLREILEELQQSQEEIILLQDSVPVAKIQPIFTEESEQYRLRQSKQAVADSQQFLDNIWGENVYNDAATQDEIDTLNY